MGWEERGGRREQWKERGVGEEGGLERNIEYGLVHHCTMQWTRKGKAYH